MLINTREIKSTLDEEDQRVLAFAARWWPAPGLLHQAIVTEFGISPIAYFQRLNRLLQVEAALAVSPELVMRLRRLRERGGRTGSTEVAGGR